MAEKRSLTPSDEDQSSTKKSKIITEVLENSEERGAKDTKPSTSNEKVKKHICDECGRCYEYIKNLLHHQRLKHGEKIATKHICSVCGNRYVESRSLHRHQRLKHGPLECNECGECFKTHEALISHITHSNTTPCDFCEEIFCSLDEFEMHKLKDHRSTYQTPKPDLGRLLTSPLPLHPV